MLPGQPSARAAAVTLAVVLAAVTGCAPAGPPRLTVYAAASLSGVFQEAGRMFEESTGADVVFSFAGSSDLVAQLEQGAAADVLATADERTMAAAAEAGLVPGRPHVFASNRLAVALAPGNPGRIDSLPDLSDALVVVCAPQVPCGAATERMTELAGLDLHPVSEESSVTDVLAKVGSGEADAGIVYRTDLLRAAPGVEGMEIPDRVNARTSYPIAVLHGPREDLAERFTELILGETGRRVLTAAGFEVPS